MSDRLDVGGGGAGSRAVAKDGLPILPETRDTRTVRTAAAANVTPTNPIPQASPTFDSDRRRVLPGSMHVGTWNPEDGVVLATDSRGPIGRGSSASTRASTCSRAEPKRSPTSRLQARENQESNAEPKAAPRADGVSMG